MPDCIIGQGTDCIAQAVNDLFQRNKDFVTEPLLTDFFPNLLNWVHLRRVWRNIKQLYVFWNLKLLRFMPCCTITAQKNQIVRELLRQFIKKYTHPIRIAIRKNQEKGISCCWFDCSIGIPVFTDVMTRYRWASTLFTPTVLWLIDSTKPGFILEHQPHLLIWIILSVDIILQLTDSGFNFFEVSMTSSLAFLGCLLLGIIFRQP